MNQTTALLETLKKYLKAKGITYKQLAEKMELSEASLKRMFSKKIFSLARLEEVCRILDIDFYALAVMDKERSRDSVETLSIEQEQVLLNDEKMLIFLYFLINGWDIPQIIAQYDFSETEAGRLLRNLEKLGVIERHLKNNVRLLISKNVFWQTNGPLWQAYRDIFVEDFMASQFGSPNERLIFSPGQFSETSLKIISRKIDNLIKEFNQLAEMDSALPLKKRRSTGMLIGFRNWVFTGIANLRRHSKEDRRKT